MLGRMITVIGKSTVFAIFAILLMYGARTYLKTDLYLSDIGGIQSFLGVFGTLYGIMAAFVVFEVWNQYNRTTDLIDKEAAGLERLFRLTIYFRDKKLLDKMKAAIKKYAGIVIADRFQKLGSGEINAEAGKAFREITEVIRNVKFNDNHDGIIFDHLVAHYGDLGQIRTQRINQSLARLPALLKTFLYTSSLFALLFFILMPFSNIYYGFMATGFLAFVLAMVFQLVEDLDNPFVGYWNITPESFERALKNIDEYSQL